MRRFRSRALPADRTDVQAEQPTANKKTFLPPIKGMITNANPAAQDERSARFMVNFLPNQRTIVPRGGKVHKLTLPARVEQVVNHPGDGLDFWFAATDTEIYRFNPITQPSDPLDVMVSGQTSGDYSFISASTDDIAYLFMVNGADDMQRFDGTSWQVINASSTPAITGVETSRLSHVWAYRNRHFFIERGTLNAWYLPTNQLTGAAIQLPLNGVFRRGGSLIAGASWSVDSGDGTDDRCVFMTDQGEFAVYSGSNPAQSDSWGLIGVYDISPPLHKNAMFSVGGDLIVATKAGFIPLSAAVQKEPEDLALTSLSFPIEPTWLKAISQAGNNPRWNILKWETAKRVLAFGPVGIGVPQAQFAQNTETKAWTTLAGWDVTAAGILSDRFFFGSSHGKIYEGFSGGRDDGAAFEAQVEFAPSHFDHVDQIKITSTMQAKFEHTQPVNVKFGLFADYSSAFPLAPDAAPAAAGSNATWDEATWDEAAWSGSVTDRMASTARIAIEQQGEVLAPRVQVTSDGDVALDVELFTLTVFFEVGEAIT